MAGCHSFSRADHLIEQSRNDFANSYELAYRHHIQTALQMGQFYTPELPHHSSAAAGPAAAVIRTPSTGSSHTGNNTLLTTGGLWDTTMGGNRSRQQLGYHQPSLLPSSGDPWSNGRVPTSTMTQRCGPQKSSTKKPRRRVANVSQRRAANIRERRRMFNLNEAFDKLRRKVPTFAYEKRLSRIETLRLAVTYISFMSDMLEVPDRQKPVLSSHLYGVNNTETSLIMNSHSNQNVPSSLTHFPLARIYSPHSNAGGLDFISGHTHP